MIKSRHILVTGANGFIGKNLIVRLQEIPSIQVMRFDRGDNNETLRALIEKSDAIVHLAGENRPDCDESFFIANTELTRMLCDAIRFSGRNIPLIFSSSAQADFDNPYGKSKLGAEQIISAFSAETGNSSVVYRLPGVFGKWCKPNYNSVVATFCYNISRNLPIEINDASVNLELVFIDDVIDDFLRVLENSELGFLWGNLTHTYNIKLGDLADQILAFKNCRARMISENVGSGLLRALYSTYISYLPSNQFAYDVPIHKDDRGIFVEMLKTKDSGQFSFFTVNPGVTRGSHYHHTKTEKFLVVSGDTRMRFRNLVTGETCEIIASSKMLRIVDSVPGWVHDITNIGNSEAIVMLWANEIFDKKHPDSIPCEV
jgi:UDP-2-acetamido-2,6-beta-L-arabino-hexul-4-ose reductase